MVGFLSIFFCMLTSYAESQTDEKGRNLWELYGEHKSNAVKETNEKNRKKYSKKYKVNNISSIRVEGRNTCIE